MTSIFLRPFPLWVVLWTLLGLAIRVEASAQGQYTVTASADGSNFFEFEVSFSNTSTAGEVLYIQQFSPLRITHATSIVPAVPTGGAANAYTFAYVPGSADAAVAPLYATLGTTYNVAYTSASRLMQVVHASNLFGNSSAAVNCPIQPGTTVKVGKFRLTNTTRDFVAGASVGLSWVTTSAFAAYVGTATSSTTFNTSVNRTLGAMPTIVIRGTPTVASPTVTSITSSGATLGGNVTSDGGASISGRGVVYALTSANNDPTIDGTGVANVTDSGTTGVFTAAVTGLTSNSGYSYKAYAINSLGTNYSSVATFTTLPSADANLSALSLSDGTLAPAFASATTSYSASVGNAVTSLTVTPTVNQANATVKARVNDSGSWASVPSVTSGLASGSLTLDVGSNTVQVEVTAEDATTKTYSVTVTRRTNLEDWRLTYSGLGGDNAVNGSDNLSNLEKYAFGIDPDPGVSAGQVAVNGGVITPGKPAIVVQSNSSTSLGVKVRFVRRNTRVADGLNYTVKFSTDLTTWETSTVTPVVVASDSDFEVVEVPYPLFLGGKKAGFLSVVVSLVN